MEKMKLHSPDLTQANIEKIRALFPDCVTEAQDEETGALRLAVDFDQLRQELSDHIVEGPQERYQLDWPGKRKARGEAKKRITTTLRPYRGESVNFDDTKNLFIEGDNLDTLKLLQKAYLGKVKLIYIDPPYNTGQDFIYTDKFTLDKDGYLVLSNQKDENGNKTVADTETVGRFHSAWLSFIYPRLKLARNLLSDDGIIFISIDDNEQANLRKLCNEIFGTENCISDLVWNLSGGTQAGHFVRSHEYVLAFAKNKEALPYFKDNSGGMINERAIKRISAANPASEVTFKKGSIKFDGSDATFEGELGQSEKRYITKGKMVFKDGCLTEDVTIKAGWAMKNQLLSWLDGKETYDSKGQKIIRFYFNPQGILYYEKERGTTHPKSVLPQEVVGSTKRGSDEIINLFDAKIMDFPKPSTLIGFFANLVTSDDDIILDFFAGSCTTADAVMQLNATDGSNRKFIMVQFPEKCAPESEAAKVGYTTIAEIGKERIRRAGAKILEGKCHKDWQQDIGFRTLKIDSSNRQDVERKPHETKQEKLLESVDNFKSDRTDEDLLFEVLVDLGVDLDSTIHLEKHKKKDVYFVNENELIACFDKINDDLVKIIADHKPERVVFRDNGFTSDAMKANIAQFFRQKSRKTKIKVI